MMRCTELDVGALVLHPAEHYASPMDVVRDNRVRWEDRKRILESWVLDAQEDPQAEAENMPGVHPPQLREAHLALLELERLRRCELSVAC
ncbi:MAG: hypothetical protein U1F14_07460 [Steroidobacteraceae bacterium]